LGFRFFEDCSILTRGVGMMLLRWQGGGVLDLAEQDPESRAE
jgi:hypothetical protein